jgi:hypothetical protein
MVSKNCQLVPMFAINCYRLAWFTHNCHSLLILGTICQWLAWLANCSYLFHLLVYLTMIGTIPKYALTERLKNGFWFATNDGKTYMPTYGKIEQRLAKHANHWQIVPSTGKLWQSF